MLPSTWFAYAPLRSFWPWRPLTSLISLARVCSSVLVPSLAHGCVLNLARSLHSPLLRLLARKRDVARRLATFLACLLARSLARPVARPPLLSLVNSYLLARQLALLSVSWVALTCAVRACACASCHLLARACPGLPFVRARACMGRGRLLLVVCWRCATGLRQS